MSLVPTDPRRRPASADQEALMASLAQTRVQQYSPPTQTPPPYPGQQPHYYQPPTYYQPSQPVYHPPTQYHQQKTHREEQLERDVHVMSRRVDEMIDKLRCKNRKIDHLNDIIDDGKVSMQDKTQHIQKLERMLQEKSRLVTQLERVLQEKSRSVTQLEQRIGELEGKLKVEQKRVKRKRKENHALLQEIDEMRGQMGAGKAVESEEEHEFDDDFDPDADDDVDDEPIVRPAKKAKVKGESFDVLMMEPGVKIKDMSVRPRRYHNQLGMFVRLVKVDNGVEKYYVSGEWKELDDFHKKRGLLGFKHDGEWYDYGDFTREQLTDRILADGRAKYAGMIVCRAE